MIYPSDNFFSRDISLIFILEIFLLFVKLMNIIVAIVAPVFLLYRIGKKACYVNYCNNFL